MKPDPNPLSSYSPPLWSFSAPRLPEAWCCHLTLFNEIYKNICSNFRESFLDEMKDLAEQTLALQRSAAKPMPAAGFFHLDILYVRKTTSV